MRHRRDRERPHGAQAEVAERCRPARLVLCMCPARAPRRSPTMRRSCCACAVSVWSGRAARRRARVDTHGHRARVSAEEAGRAGQRRRRVSDVPSASSETSGAVVSSAGAARRRDRESARRTDADVAGRIALLGARGVGAVRRGSSRRPSTRPRSRGPRSADCIGEPATAEPEYRRTVTSDESPDCVPADR